MSLFTFKVPIAVSVSHSPFSSIFTINIIPFLTEKHKEITPVLPKKRLKKPAKTTSKRLTNVPEKPTFWLACPRAKKQRFPQGSNAVFRAKIETRKGAENTACQAVILFSQGYQPKKKEVDGGDFPNGKIQPLAALQAVNTQTV